MCTHCLENNLYQWVPNEETVREYVLKCQPGEASVSVTKETNYNVISKPKHYMLFEDEGIEVRDVLEKLVVKLNDGFVQGKVPEGNHAPLFDSDYVQLMQYLMRFMDKNGKEDLEKARWYLDKLIESY
jgi:hypothetical protein